jgi:hypothetical protein
LKEWSSKARPIPLSISIHYYFFKLVVVDFDFRTKDPYLADRVVQALEAGNFIEATSTGSDLCFYCGDFNTEPGDLPHQILTGLFRLNDSHEKSLLKTHYRQDNSFTEPQITRSITIDYILHKPVDHQNARSETLSLKLPLKHRIPLQIVDTR